MNYLKKIGIGLGYIIAISLISVLLLTILNYFSIIGSKMVVFLEIIIAFISMFIGGFVVGKRSNQKGWLEGLKFGGIFLIFIVLLNLILKNDIEIKNIIYYIIILFSTIFGSIIGINKNIDKK